MAFCTSCGHSNADDNQFCEQCGKPLRATAPTSVAASGAGGLPASMPQKPKLNKRAIQLVAGGVAALVVVGGAVSFLFSDESATPEHLQAAATRYIAAHPDFAKARYCVKNFAYETDPVFVNVYDTGTQGWLSVLVQAGIYTQPEQVSSGNAYFPTTSLKYTKTESGKAATSTGALCVATGIVVTKVDLVREQKGGSTPVLVADVTFSLKDAAPWVKSPEAAGGIPDAGADFSKDWRFEIKDRKWEMVSGNGGGGGSARGEGATAVASPGSNSGGLLSRLANLISFGRNPILGKWSMGMLGFTSIVEFLPEEMRGDGGLIKVRYEVKDGEVVIYPADKNEGIIVKIVDDNTISMSGILATRVK